MEEVLSRCGFRWNLCLAYRPNVEQNKANRQSLSDGCLNEQGLSLDLDCPIKLCVIVKRLENRARVINKAVTCSKSPCDVRGHPGALCGAHPERI
jgi:hypothetical protein